VSADVGVVGAGIVGLCTAYALTERGASVAVYERGVPGNDQSGGESRIFRHAHDDPRLVAFARDSRAIWREWQERLGVELVSSDGALAIGDAVEDRMAVIDEVGDIPARRIDSAEIAEHLPLLADYDGPAMLDAGGGAIRTRAAVEGLAAELGERLTAEEVLSVRALPGGGAEVRAGGVRAEHAHVVVCAGRETARFARGAGVEIPVSLAAHVRITFGLAAGREPPSKLACLQDSSGAFGETGIYAAPLPDNTGYAVGLSETTERREDGSELEPEALASLAQRACDYVAKALPGLSVEPAEHRHCWVTTLPWSEDGVAAWQAGDVHYVAGHNLFKQAPGLGRALAAAATGDGLPEVLRPRARLGEPQ
jgi:sarcosine oxidase